MTMDGAGSDNPAPRPGGHEAADELDGESAAVEISAGADGISLEELAAQLEEDPGECRRACEGLEAVDVETRVSIIQGLAGIPAGAGVISLIQLLAASESAETREAALAVQKILDGRGDGVLRASSVEAEPGDDPGAGQAQGVLDVAIDSSQEIVLVGDPARPRLVNCLVTAVDGMGRGSVAISATRRTERCTAVFLCDVERGITDAIGQVEAERQGVGALLEVAKAQAGGLGIEGIPELALRLLAVCLSLSGPAPARPVMEWLERTLGRGFEPRPLPAPTAEGNLEPAGSSDLLLRADEVLRACPTWLDRSPLTFELAEEVCLREGRVAVDPHRDSGAFRFLFEHRIIHRLELYRRMLLWMHWFWRCAGELELAGSARILAWQLSDEQFAVPSHPFAVALMARSLNAARDRLGTEDDPRPPRRVT
ncbi:MAG TPA: hypothetical protein VKF17_12200 [Isosphaeraceae bacterium]|nr:hypothetical protein [Isosphaeraceae bacterium]